MVYQTIRNVPHKLWQTLTKFDYPKEIGSYAIAAYPPMEYLDSDITHAFLRSFLLYSKFK